MAATVTMTGTDRVYRMVLTLREEGLETLLDRLLLLLETYQREDDPLSLALLLWGEELCALLYEGKDRKAIALKLYEIRNIAQNPLDRAPLEEPRLAGGRLWERWMLEQVARLFDGVSCYADEASLDEIREHLFLKEVLLWLSDVLCREEISVEFEGLKADEDRSMWLPKGEKLTRVQWVRLAGFVEREEKLSFLEGRVKQARKNFQEIAKASKERGDREIEAIKSSLEAGEKELAEDLERIRAVYQRMISDLRRTLDEAKRSNLILQDRVAATEGKVEQLHERVSDLERRLFHAEEQNRANRAAANSGGGGGCVIM